MCTINGTCGCNNSSSGFLTALLTVAAVETVKAAWWLLKNTTYALAVLTVLTARWTWRAGRRAHLRHRIRRAERQAHQLTGVVADRQPVAAVTDKPTGTTLADLRLKEPANS